MLAWSGYVGTAAPGQWTLLGSGFYDGSGKSELLWQDTSGNLYEWSLNGSQLASGAYVGTVPQSSGWSLVGA